MAEFHETPMGRKYFESTMPSIAEQLKRIANAMNEPRVPTMNVCAHDECDQPPTTLCVEHARELTTAWVASHVRDRMLHKVFTSLDSVKRFMCGEASTPEDAALIMAWDGKAGRHVETKNWIAVRAIL